MEQWVIDKMLKEKGVELPPNKIMKPKKTGVLIVIDILIVFIVLMILGIGFYLWYYYLR